MKYTWISALAVMLAVPGIGFGQSDSSRLQKSGIPTAGDTLTIHYNPKGGPLEGKDHIYGLVYTYRNYRWDMDDVPMQLHNGVYDGKYYVPGNCALVAFKFFTEQDGNITAFDNNNDHGFVETTISKENGAALPGGALAWGLFRKPSLGRAPQGYFDKFEISDEAIELWVRKEMRNYPQFMSRYFGDYLAMLKISLGDEYNEKVERNLVRYAALPDANEKGFMEIQRVYQFDLKDTHKGDSVKAMILAKYPHGQMARHQAFTAAYNGEQSDAKLAQMEKFLQDFPVADMRKDTSAWEQEFMYYSIFREMAVGDVATGKMDRLISLLPQMDFKTLAEVYRWNVERHFMTNSMPLDSVYPLGKAMMAELIAKAHDGSYKENLRFTPRQADEFAITQLDKKLAAHTRMLAKMGKYDEALTYVNMISPDFIYTNAKLNDAHIEVLEHTGNGAKADVVLQMGISNNAATPAMIEKLKKAYTEKHGNADGFDQYMESLKPAADKEKLKAELKAHLINEPYTPFKLKDLSGKVVNSADWKDKIVVIDFWATWCTPCKAAFPGMQMAVDKYAKDPNVAFYFIATQETSATFKEDIKKYITKSGYRFNILLDEVNAKNNGRDRVFRTMAPVFKSSGIPRKIVVKNGVIRYTAEGYGGSPSKLVDELSYVIELLKNEN